MVGSIPGSEPSAPGGGGSGVGPNHGGTNALPCANGDTSTDTPSSSASHDVIGIDAVTATLARGPCVVARNPSPTYSGGSHAAGSSMHNVPSGLITTASDGSRRVVVM